MQVIHYIASTAALRPGELVLVDAGCEYHGYTSDITRTWPGVSGIIVTMGALCDDVVTNDRTGPGLRGRGSCTRWC